MDEEIILISAEESGERIDALLALHSELSRNAAQRLIEQGYVLLNGQPARKNTRCKENDLLDLIAADDKFGLTREELEAKMNPADYVGRSPRQVEVYLRDFVKPVLDANKELLGATGVVNV